MPTVKLRPVQPGGIAHTAAPLWPVARQGPSRSNIITAIGGSLGGTLLAVASIIACVAGITLFVHWAWTEEAPDDDDVGEGG